MQDFVQKTGASRRLNRSVKAAKAQRPVERFVQRSGRGRPSCMISDNLRLSVGKDKAKMLKRGTGQQSRSTGGKSERKKQRGASGKSGIDDQAADLHRSPAFGDEPPKLERMQGKKAMTTYH